ncbi:unnamed protein product [Miscanthus lutarioriparius]|uniref:DUF4218 domain-containing protein n=1 Tax=Miscanthus lutarioriparius TaxID=422564 RepID=A0A811REH5_9POAL|nr:unnamed protein product [Miscanthus lutarioriparius]
MARPEGSIAEAYVAVECLTICSRYFGDDVETRHNQEGRNRERVDGQLRAMMNAKPTGAAKQTGAASEDSGSLYKPGDEDMEQGVDKEAMLDLELELNNNMPNNVSKNIGGSGTSKRVTAIPEEQSQSTRITRKRARELSEPTEVCHVLATDPQDGAIDQERERVLALQPCRLLGVDGDDVARQRTAVAVVEGQFDDDDQRIVVIVLLLFLQNSVVDDVDVGARRWCDVRGAGDESEGARQRGRVLLRCCWRGHGCRRC